MLWGHFFFDPHEKNSLYCNVFLKIEKMQKVFSEGCSIKSLYVKSPIKHGNPTCMCVWRKEKCSDLSIIREDDVDTVSKVGSEKGPEVRAPRIKLAML